jgi:hypothetical protein
MTSKTDLSIIILSWNTKDLLKDCLHSIVDTKKNNKKYEIIVVDNGSTDQSVDWVKQFSPEKDNIKLKLIENKENLGFAKGNNQAVKQAKGNYILLLNSDTIILDQAVDKTLKFMALNKNVDIAGCKLLNKDKTIQPSVGKFPSLAYVFKMLYLDRLLKQTGGAWSMTSPIKTQEVDWITGAFMMAKKEAFDQIGGLDENIFMYFEEVEWCYRASQADKNIFFYPNAKIIHLGGGSSTSGKTGPILHIYQGIDYFYQKHKPKWQQTLVKIMLKTKAAGTYLLGLLSNNQYLKKTYGQAFKLV